MLRPFMTPITFLFIETRQMLFEAIMISIDQTNSQMLRHEIGMLCKAFYRSY